MTEMRASTKESPRRNLEPSSVRIDPKIVLIANIMDRLFTRQLILPRVLQARYKWNRRLRSRLIESMLLRIPLSTFCFDESVEGTWRVVDGMQRLFAIRDFMNGVYSLEYLQYFRDKETGKSFSELSSGLQRRISESRISVQVIDCAVPSHVKDNIFERIRFPEYLDSQGVYLRKKYIGLLGE